MIRFGGSKRHPARGRKKPGEMNKTEARFEAEILRPMLGSGVLLWYAYEAVTFKIGPDCRYTPDFCAQRADGVLVAYEVKAGKRDGSPLVTDDAAVKIRVAAQQFPVVFRLCWPASSGAWSERTFLPEEEGE